LAFIRRTAPASKISTEEIERKDRLLQQGLMCFVAGIVCFVVGATLVTTRYDLPDFTRSVGQFVFAGWPVLTLAAAFLRWRGGGVKDWLLWTTLAVVFIPALMVVLLVR
jgi:hypothetical protein